MGKCWIFVSWLHTYLIIDSNIYIYRRPIKTAPLLIEKWQREVYKDAYSLNILRQFLKLSELHNSWLSIIWHWHFKFQNKKCIYFVVNFRKQVNMVCSKNVIVLVCVRIYICVIVNYVRLKYVCFCKLLACR